ncbi:MAG: 2-C-methyl-D-erythritol 4-phosphate cytidylyltransferase [Candidatus Omnitrophica bacterium]|nr:2-C-methyl-D-erythritol 4-phosphate cytidylyltransferase [Candidatus Omnitrophota bacterium]
MKASAVIVCAGYGRRLGKIDKAVLELEGKPLFYYAVKTFAGIDEIKEIVLVLRKKHLRAARVLIPHSYHNKKVFFVEGGARRQDSVCKGLAAVSSSVDNVLIHDGARPFISNRVIKNILNKLKKSEAVICGVKVPDTVKIVEKGIVKKTVERDNLYLIQTPQGFRRQLILTAYEQFGASNVTDDSSMLESLGYKVEVVKGDELNMKITYPQDIALAEAIIKRVKGQGSRGKKTLNIM